VCAMLGDIGNLQWKVTIFIMNSECLAAYTYYIHRLVTSWVFLSKLAVWRSVDNRKSPVTEECL